MVEPVTYFTSQLWAILGYCYFLVSSRCPPVHVQQKLQALPWYLHKNP